MAAPKHGPTESGPAGIAVADEATCGGAVPLPNLELNAT